MTTVSAGTPSGSDGTAAAGSISIRPFAVDDTEAVVALWRAAGLVKPWNDPYLDIERKLTVQPELFLVAVGGDGALVGTAMVGYEGHRGWVNYLAVADPARGTGLGRALMAEAERLLVERGCPKLNLQVRSSNTDVIAFYERLGYAVDDAVSLGKRLIPDA
ncbi:GNAT family acetyltransferase [Agromyces endophyticus]|uniref:GNAT family acetyltransferase n=1 Tax=Agromyces sp. H17E-10 TaxID=2932244 RepID=UPI001FD52181|nr:GNAT family acetyltransferase [Agromyces sp. H17E-10]UOQ88766.1 GNAT family acetyltransferase [Agromyces sp. H17E-10]